MCAAPVAVAMGKGGRDMNARILRTALLGALAAAMAACLSGCLFEPVDSLYALPVLPQEYKDLQATINATMAELDAEYATISYGTNTSTIQLLDLDGDGGGVPPGDRRGGDAHAGVPVPSGG